MAKGAKNIQSKLNNKGLIAMFLGYSDVHAKDTNRMLNLQINKVFHSRDLRWIYIYIFSSNSLNGIWPISGCFENVQEKGYQ